jgi:hypothetical protein
VDEPPVERRNIVIPPDPVVIRVGVQPVGTVVESPVDHPDGRQVDYRPATGGRSVSKTSAVDGFTAELSGALVVGRDGEPRAIEVLVHALGLEGRIVAVKPRDPQQDAHGEDGRIVIGDSETVVQVVTMPADASLWRQLHDDATLSHAGDLRRAVALIRATVERKRHARGTVVVLDAAHFAALAWRPLVDAYLAEYGDPVAEFGFVDAWIIGPTVRSSLRIRSA